SARSRVLESKLALDAARRRGHRSSRHVFRRADPRALRMKRVVAILISAAASATACGVEETPPGALPAPDPAVEAVKLAERRFPSMIDLHAGVIARTCSPNRGVCHASKNSPNLTTATGLLRAIGAPCNAATPDPRAGFDACERPADRMIVGDAAIKVAWIDR